MDYADLDGVDFKYFKGCNFEYMWKDFMFFLSLSDYKLSCVVRTSDASKLDFIFSSGSKEVVISFCIDNNRRIRYLDVFINEICDVLILSNHRGIVYQVLDSDGYVHYSSIYEEDMILILKKLGFYVV